MRRAHELDRGLAIGELILHDLGNGESRESRFNGGLQHLCQFGARCGTACDQVVLLAVGFASKRLDIHMLPALGRELFEQCGRRCA